MAPFLSPAWLDDLDRAVRTSDSLAALTTEALVVEQVVDEVPHRGTVRYQLVLGPHEASVDAHPSRDPTITITCAYESAAGINRGEQSAQTAFMEGRLRIGGDIASLIRHREAMAALDDVLAAVRERTTY